MLQWPGKRANTHQEDGNSWAATLLSPTFLTHFSHFPAYITTRTIAITDLFSFISTVLAIWLLRAEMVSSSTSISASGFSVEASSSLSSSADSPPFKRPQEVETVCSEWTDRKHQFYLNSLETSFIHQLYRSEYGSTDLLGRPLKTEKCQTSQGPNANPLSYQVRWGNFSFKRQRGWANINNGKGLHWKGCDASSKVISDENFVGIDLEEGEEQNEVTSKRTAVEATIT